MGGRGGRERQVNRAPASSAPLHPAATGTAGRPPTASKDREGREMRVGGRREKSGAQGRREWLAFQAAAEPTLQPSAPAARRRRVAGLRVGGRWAPRALRFECALGAHRRESGGEETGGRGGARGKGRAPGRGGGAVCKWTGPIGGGALGKWEGLGRRGGATGKRTRL